MSEVALYRPAAGSHATRPPHRRSEVNVSLSDAVMAPTLPRRAYPTLAPPQSGQCAASVR
jgi:hypothetical protein